MPCPWRSHSCLVLIATSSLINSPSLSLSLLLYVCVCVCICVSVCMRMWGHVCVCVCVSADRYRLQSLSWWITCQTVVLLRADYGARMSVPQLVVYTAANTSRGPDERVSSDCPLPHAHTYTRACTHQSTHTTTPCSRYVGDSWRKY